MSKILSVEQAIKESKRLRESYKAIVLAGGCFDILHAGHVIFLEKAKGAGDALFVLLESDEHIKKNKGENRPINTQGNRAKILASLTSVDAVIKLPKDLADSDYDTLILEIKPDVIATTKGDLHREHKERQVNMLHSQLLEVTDIISDQSTSRLVTLLEKEL